MTLSFYIGGGDRDRTCDLLNANQMLSRLSYAPMNFSVDRVRVFLRKSFLKNLRLIFSDSKEEVKTLFVFLSSVRPAAPPGEKDFQVLTSSFIPKIRNTEEWEPHSLIKVACFSPQPP